MGKQVFSGCPFHSYIKGLKRASLGSESSLGSWFQMLVRDGAVALMEMDVWQRLLLPW